jgi:hypothetical protein
MHVAAVMRIYQERNAASDEHDFFPATWAWAGLPGLESLQER